ncbi:MAG: LptA/OstA family protein [Acidobacteriaceae bacterium]
MRITVVRLRRGILIVGGLLVAVLIGFIFYAHYRLRHIGRDLPARLGVNIQQTASGYTYSQSSGGHTLYTLHASKLIEYKKGGNATLHDVSITLYGPQGTNRVDKIYGSDFTFDPTQQIVKAQGVVSIDLQGFGDADHGGKDTIHVKTSGLVFNKKTGDADTSGHTEFSSPQASGSCVGAHYNSKTGVLVLDHDVELTSAGAKPTVLHASHAEVVRSSMEAFLLNPRTEYESEKGSADSAIVGFREDGSASSINAKGHVRLVTKDGAVLTATNSLTQLNDKSKPTNSELTGGVNYLSKTADGSTSGSANAATLTFGDHTMLKHASFRNAVSFVDQVFKLAHDSKGTASRSITASRLDVDFVPGPKGKHAIAQKVLAMGNASVALHTVPSKGPPQATTIYGDQLLADLTADGKAIRRLNGSGNTEVVELAKDGSTNTSKGDRLAVTFAMGKTPRPATGTGKSAHSRMEIASAIQDGHVILIQQPKQGPGPVLPPTMKAWAQHAEYRASDQVLHLTGSPRLQSGKMLQMSANQIDYQRESGDASALGDVKATYSEKPGAASGPTLGGEGPVHITADRAVMRRANGASKFFGTDGTDARMWQGGNSILAPVLELTRKPATLRAYGRPDSSGAVVEANLASATGKKRATELMRIQSRELYYSDADRRGDFRGDVTARDSDGTIYADDTQVYLTPTAKPGAKAAAGRRAGKSSELERIVAVGHVVLTQPGRKGVGERLVYTAADGRYVLTGAPGNPPRIEDATKGTTMGSTLIFNSQNDSVVVSGGQSRAVTETRAPKK